jgi:plastocyanin
MQIFRHSLRALLVALALGASQAAAQTTHFVDNGPGFDFSPASLTVAVGDTVTWVWQGGVHTVYSATAGLPNGIFSSGVATGTVGHTFSVTFDAAFVSANPVPNNDYDYICTIHVGFGQEGTIHVVQPPLVSPFGCLNPAGSLATVSGVPKVNASWTVSVHNPLLTQASGSLAFLSIASASAAGYPCGTPVPGFGMSGAGATGELLIALNPPNPLVSAGPIPWTGTPANFPLAIPNLATLAGAKIYLQGLILDPTPAAAVLFGATSGLEATIGS